MRTFQAGPYELRWSEGIRAEAYDHAPYYVGVIFHVGDVKYDVVDNPLLGTRLLITNLGPYGGHRDIPFHLGTAGLLPPGIEVTTPR